MRSQGPWIPHDEYAEPRSAGWTWLPNEGQVFDLGGGFRDDVLFHTVGTFPSLYAMEENRIAIVVPDSDLPDHVNDSIFRVDFAFTGQGAKSPIPILWEEVPQHYNFYETNTPQGVLDVTGGKRVIYEEMYDFIDLHMYSNKWGPKLYIVVRPGGNPNEIQITWSGQDSLKIDLDGYLKVWFDNRYVKLTQGMAYQQVGSTIVDVPWTAAYNLQPDGLTAKFQFDAYDPELPLILMVRPFNPDVWPMGGGGEPIPPEWCTFLAGAEDEAINDLTHDAEGYVYFTGYSRSGASQLPISPGAFQPQLNGIQSDVIIGRFNRFYEIESPDTWMTYLGGPDSDVGQSLANDDVNGRLAVGGFLMSDFIERPNIVLPSNPNCWQREVAAFFEGDGFLAFTDRLNGHVNYLTRTPNHAYPPPLDLNLETDVAVDENGFTYVVGGGGWSILQAEWEVNNALPATAYVETNGNNPEDPVENPYLLDGVVVRVDPEANLNWVTPLGGWRLDFAFACATDPFTKRLYIVGQSQSANAATSNDCNLVDGTIEFPICDAGGYAQTLLNGDGTSGLSQADGTIMAFSYESLAMDWSSYFGGAGYERIHDVTVDSQGNVYVTGFTSTNTYSPTLCDVQGPTTGFPACNPGGFFVQDPDSRRQFIAKFNSDTHLLWSTKVGDNNADVASRIRLTMDADDNVHVFGSSRFVTGTYTPPIDFYPYANCYFQDFHRDAINPTKRDAYLGVFDPETDLIGSTYFGGYGDDVGRAITAIEGRVYIGGATYSLLQFPTNAPTIPDHSPYLNETPQAVLNQKADGFLAQLRYEFTIGVEDVDDGEHDGTLAYPNPASNELIITPHNLVAGSWTVLVRDALGQVVREQRVSGGRTAIISLVGLTDGFYTAHARTGTGETVSKFIIQR